MQTSSCSGTGVITDSGSGSENISPTPVRFASSVCLGCFLAFILETYTVFGTHFPSPPSTGVKQKSSPQSFLETQDVLTGIFNWGSGVTAGSGSENISPTPVRFASSVCLGCFLAFILETYTVFGTHFPSPPSTGVKQKSSPQSFLETQDVLTGIFNWGSGVTAGSGVLSSNCNISCLASASFFLASSKSNSDSFLSSIAS